MITIQLLKQLISIPSFSREEKAVADAFQREMELMGHAVYRKDNNLWLLSAGFDTDKPTILLNSHIDTVKPVNGWTFDPFTPTEKEGKLYGLGSNDAGASVVSLLETFCRLTEKGQPYNLIFTASAEEEISGTNGIENLLKELPKINVAVVGEPTGMQMAVAEKGLMVLDCTSYGKAGHAARNEGENALYKAMQDIDWFKNYHFPKESNDLGDVKMSVTMINAGTQHNVIPDTCTFVVDIRSNECYSNEELLKEIQAHVQCEVKARSTRLNSSSIEKNHALVQRGLELGLTTFGSPTLSDQALMPFPSLKMGPGDSTRSHTADEFIYIKEIEEAVKIYVELLDGLVL
ncbi:MAG: M20 family metallo-hydrolase [Paludibacteraceae bacterium]|nr:M20 family metallo-hydrolase [Paludibacteraceae bacterium]MBN2787826.1 M20 family metallo-hydrolase [Paludibacteraceae bacterium]